MNVTVSDPTGCSVVLPSLGQISGTTTVLHLLRLGPNGVRFYLHSSSQADFLIGPALLTVYGWLYSPDGGQTWGWNSANAANGTATITCEATESSGASLASAADR